MFLAMLLGEEEEVRGGGRKRSRRVGLDLRMARSERSSEEVRRGSVVGFWEVWVGMKGIADNMRAIHIAHQCEGGEKRWEEEIRLVSMGRPSSSADQAVW